MNRQVHAHGTTPDGTRFQVVRYDRAGKWYCEVAGTTRRPIGLTEAVALAVDIARRGGGQIHWNTPGGRTFDARVRKALK